MGGRGKTVSNQRLDHRALPHVDRPEDRGRPLGSNVRQAQEGHLLHRHACGPGHDPEEPCRPSPADRRPGFQSGHRRTDGGWDRGTPSGRGSRCGEGGLSATPGPCPGRSPGHRAHGHRGRSGGHCRSVPGSWRPTLAAASRDTLRQVEKFIVGGVAGGRRDRNPGVPPPFEVEGAPFELEGKRLEKVALVASGEELRPTRTSAREPKIRPIRLIRSSLVQTGPPRQKTRRFRSTRGGVGARARPRPAPGGLPRPSGRTCPLGSPERPVSPPPAVCRPQPGWTGPRYPRNPGPRR